MDMDTYALGVISGLIFSFFTFLITCYIYNKGWFRNEK